MSTAVIICNGNVSDYNYYKEYFNSAEYIICADGGAYHAKRFGIRPDILVGDFDSIPQDVLVMYKEKGIELSKFPVEKDMTDTELAIEVAVKKGYKSVVIIGGLGTRFDHSIANVFLLKKMIDKGVAVKVVDEHNEITAVRDKITLKRAEGFKVTLIPLTDRVKGVTTKGLYYTLDNATIEKGSTLGVSNEFKSELAEISLKEGILLVIKSRD